ncbi:PLP-dependent aminotransferase family protein [Chryseobacterium sp. SSA4.19]|uniref:aminotransferase-like domain-containing protein n=1 Tax=Chryseobacterium sp. SSA4.19 TaxID=2919915 RepID=UPI002076B6CB|nr:PLP-dependent aminotransferase family protein [Chryseobacterium sp. SSA4.19]
MKLKKTITKGLLKPGDRLPSVRKIKNEYELSISSVQNGYDYLVYKELVKNIPRSGFIVDDQLKKTSVFSGSDLKAIPRDPVFRKNVFITSHQRQHHEITHLHAAVPSDFLIPQKLILTTMQKIIREKGAALLRYYPSHGAEELRRLISKRSALHGALVQQEEIIITDGALQALYIALAVTTQPNDIIAIESPCIFSVLEILANLRLRAVEIPVRNNTGIDLEIVREVCRKNDIKAIVVTPNFHNPTGILMTDQAKEELYDIAAFHNLPIIENDIYGDLYFNGARPSTIRNFDNQGLVITGIFVFEKPGSRHQVRLAVGRPLLF